MPAEQPRAKLTVPDVLPLAQRVYARSVVGCCLHIVLDDDNVRDSHVELCIEQAIDRGHVDCLALALMLRQLSLSQRGRVRRDVFERIHSPAEPLDGVLGGAGPGEAFEGPPAPGDRPAS